MNRSIGKTGRWSARICSTAPFRNRDGLALVLTLAVVAVLTAMVIEFAYAVYINTSLLHNWQASQKLSLASKSAVRVAFRIITDNIGGNSYTTADIAKEHNEKIFPDSDITSLIKIEDENSKFNLNSLVFPNGTINDKAYKSFSRLLKSLNIDAGLADRLADWLDPDSEPRLGDSESGSKNAYLDSVDELLLIPDVERADYDRLLPYVTIYGSGLININSAESPVLMSLSDSIDSALAGRIARYRESTPFEKPEEILKVAGLEKEGQTLMGRITVRGTVFRVTASSGEGGIKRIIESVLEISGDSALVKYWKEM